jgi:hypothetical protein
MKLHDFAATWGSNRVRSRFTSSDADGVLHIRDKDFSVSNPARLRGFTDRIGGENGAFGASENEAALLWGRDGRERVPRGSKQALAGAILDRVLALRGKR